MGTAEKENKNNFCLKGLLISGSLTTSANATGFIQWELAQVQWSKLKI